MNWGVKLNLERGGTEEKEKEVLRGGSDTALSLCRDCSPWMTHPRAEEESTKDAAEVRNLCPGHNHTACCLIESTDHNLRQ